MLRPLVISVLFCAAAAIAPASAQQGQQNLIYQTGPSPVVPLHPMMWAGDGLAMDGGAAKPGGPGQNINEIGVVGSGLVSCVSDNYKTLPHHELCFAAVDTTTGHTGALIDFKAVGGATPVSVNCNINGVFVPDCLTQSVTFPLLQNSAAFNPTVNFSGAVTTPTDVFVLGSLTVPDTTQNPMMAIEKFTSNTTPSGVNPALYVAIRKETTVGDMRAQAAFFEAQDDVGWVPDGIHGINFVEGIRSHAALINNEHLGSAYGVIALAGETAGSTHVYLIGVESQIDNTSADATVDLNFGHISAAYNATTGGTKYSDAAYIVNPFTSFAAAFRNGFLVPASATGLTNAPVVDSAFRTDARSNWGLFMAEAHPLFGAIMLPNNSPVKGKDAAFTTDYNLLFIGADNQLWLGADPALAGLVMGDSAQTAPLFLKAPGIIMQNPANYVQLAVVQGAFASGCGVGPADHLAILSLKTDAVCNNYVNLSSDGTTLSGRLQIGPSLTNGFTIEGLTSIAAGTGKRFLCIDGTTKRIYEGTGVSCN